MIWAELLVGALATWRITHVLIHENGPWRIFRRLRVGLGVTYADDDESAVTSYRYELTVCMLCLSVWVGIGVTVVFLVTQHALYVFMPFALSAFAAAFNKALR